MKAQQQPSDDMTGLKAKCDITPKAIVGSIIVEILIFAIVYIAFKFTDIVIFLGTIILIIAIYIAVVLSKATSREKIEKGKSGYYDIQKKVNNLEMIIKSEYEILIKFDPIQERFFPTYEDYVKSVNSPKVPPFSFNDLFGKLDPETIAYFKRQVELKKSFGGKCILFFESVFDFTNSALTAMRRGRSR